MCCFNHFHDDHKLIEIKSLEQLNKENITLEKELNELNKTSDKMIKLKSKIEEEITKINNTYEDMIKKLENIYQKKIDVIITEKNDLIEKLNFEVTKVKEGLEKNLSDINNEILIKDRINKGIKKMENKEQNVFQIIAYISKINQDIKKMKNISTKLMKNININYDEIKNNITYEDYYFNGWPIPKNIKIENLTSTSAKISWDIDKHNILIKDNYHINFAIEIKKKGKNFHCVFEGIYGANTYSINNLENNTTYEIRIFTHIGQDNYFSFLSESSEIYEFKTPDYSNSIILKESNKEN